MKIIANVLIVLLLFSCNILPSPHKKMPDKIIIYKLPDFADYYRAVKCEEIKKMDEAKKIVIDDKEEIKDFCTIFNTEKNFIEDTNFHYIDSRMLIEYISEDKIVKQICWSEVKMIQMNGKIYRYTIEIEKFLLSKELIKVIIL